MKTPARYKVMCAPSGWAVYEIATGKCIHQLSCSQADRIAALKVAYSLNGWVLPKRWR
jgi:hypothetical protein|uniref:Uncharacterized protein n=1 Tax=Myoviridae sp. ctx322 TaxID=2826711 RepID=A0A8S5NBC9_9CAUD|nr:MAG TPA: hypothetical protein [Myoviridae sp. ctx322]